MTLKEIVYQIQNLKSGGIKSGDNKLSDEQVADIVHYYRAKLIKQELDRGSRLDPALIQPIFDLQVDRVPFNRKQPISGKTVFKTVKQIPRAISTKGTNLVTFVGDNLLGRAYQRSTPTKVQLDVFRSYTGLSPKWFEFDSCIYVITEDSLTDIVVQLVAENPTKVNDLNQVGNVYDPLEYEYPLSVTMLDSIFKLMADMELKYGSLPTDDMNDGQEAPTIKQK